MALDFDAIPDGLPIEHECGPLCRDGRHAELFYTPYAYERRDFVLARCAESFAAYGLRLADVEPAYDAMPWRDYAAGYQIANAGGTLEADATDEPLPWLFILEQR